MRRKNEGSKILMKCGSCSFTDGCCYTSLPPNVKCTITNEYHYYEDECNCEEARLSRDEELAMIKKLLNSKPFYGVDYGNLTAFSDTTTASEALEFSWPATAAVAVGCTSCLVCGEDVILHDFEVGPSVCHACKKAIKFIKEKFKDELA
jgi:hypothetical protein